MKSHVIWITLIIAVQFSAVLGRNHFYEYYYSRFHKRHSTTTALSFSTADDDDSLENEKHSSTDGDSVENPKHIATADFVPTHSGNKTINSYSYDYNGDTQYAFALRSGLVVGFSVLFAICSCCLFCCIRILRRRNDVRRGFVINSRIQGASTAVYPQQPTANYPSLIPPQRPPQYQEERGQVFAPHYQPQMMQQQYLPVQQNVYESQHSPSAPHDHNPPEAPPPYEFPEKF